MANVGFGGLGFSPLKEGLKLGKEGLKLGKEGLQLGKEGLQLGNLAKGLETPLKEGLKLGKEGLKLGKEGLQLGKDGLQLGKDQLGKDGLQLGKRLGNITQFGVKSKKDDISAALKKKDAQIESLRSQNAKLKNQLLLEVHSDKAHEELKSTLVEKGAVQGEHGE
jgi:hypothetical protein